MKRQTRISNFKDYVAIDEVKEDGTILSTPLYFPKGETVSCNHVNVNSILRHVFGERKTKVDVTFDGEKMKCVQAEGVEKGMEWEEQISDKLHLIFR